MSATIRPHEVRQAQRFATPPGEIRPVAEVLGDRRFRPSPVPERSLRQRMDALEKGNVIRVKRKELKWDLKAGRVTVADVLLSETPDWLATMKIEDLLRAAPKVGKVKAAKVLRYCAVSPSKTIAGLSLRQRTELASMVRR
jgi:hypothetical protein